MPLVPLSSHYHPRGQAPAVGGGGGSSLTHLMGVSASSPTVVSYRARAGQDATLQIRVGTNSDLSGATTSAGTAVTSTSDYTGGETISSLTAGTQHYYDILVDGES